MCFTPAAWTLRRPGGRLPGSSTGKQTPRQVRGRKGGTTHRGMAHTRGEEGTFRDKWNPPDISWCLGRVWGTISQQPMTRIQSSPVHRPTQASCPHLSGEGLGHLRRVHGGKETERSRRAEKQLQVANLRDRRCCGYSGGSRSWRMKGWQLSLGAGDSCMCLGLCELAVSIVEVGGAK